MSDLLGSRWGESIGRFDRPASIGLKRLRRSGCAQSPQRVRRDGWAGRHGCGIDGHGGERFEERPVEQRGVA
jgi:hypothetical protein